MNSSIETTSFSSAKSLRAKKSMKKAAQVLFIIAVAGQLLFVYHIISFYGGTAWAGEMEKWNDNLMNGLMEQDWWGNRVLVLHLILAAIILLGGPLQFIPILRKRYPTFHRWNGKLYVLTAFGISLAGLYLIYSRDVLGGKWMAAGNSLNATMIMFFAGKMWYSAAIQRDFMAHKRWALRTFLAVSGVWFFRIGYGLWIAVTFGNAPGTENNLSGSFDHFLAFAHALLPLAILEIYFWIQGRNIVKEIRVMTVALLILSLALTIGIGIAAIIFWW